MTIERTSNASQIATTQTPVPERRAAVTLSAADLVCLAALGMEGFDAEVGRRTAAQRKETGALKVLGELKAKMAKYQKGLDDSDDGDEKRAGGDSKRGAGMRRVEFAELQTAFKAALEQLPPEHRAAAQSCLDTLREKNKSEFDENQAGRMMETIESHISDIDSRSQAAMAEINNLVSQRANMIEMTKNIATALNSQQENIVRNAPR